MTFPALCRAYVVSPEYRELTTRHIALMSILATAPASRVRHLATALKVHKPIVTRAITVLTGMGFAERLTDDLDKRDRLVSLTAAGAAYLEKLEAL